MQVVDEQYTNDKATDFMAILTAIKSKKPDAIFYGGMDPQGGPMLRQMEQLGMTNVKYFGGDGICTARAGQAVGRRQDAGQRGLRRGRRLAGEDARRRGVEEALRREVPGPVPGLLARTPTTPRACWSTRWSSAGSADPKVYLPVLAEDRTTRA